MDKTNRLNISAIIIMAGLICVSGINLFAQENTTNLFEPDGFRGDLESTGKEFILQDNPKK